MQEYLFIPYCLFLVTGIAVGLARYKQFDKAMRILVLWLLMIVIAELSTYFLIKSGKNNIKPIVFHLSSVIEIILISAFFLRLLKPPHYASLMFANILFWPIVGGLNIIFLQPITQLNTNMLMLESFSIISMSLYFIYQMLKNDLVENIFQQPHFWISVLWLILWGSTFFFWAFIRILYKNNWTHVGTVMNLHAATNLIVYAGITSVLFFYPKKITTLDYS